nr:UDP-N-acetylglucosamine 1-carboxyvinyltransferase [Bacilli bacterium]
MDRLIVRGGRRLEGALRVQGAKNAALPILAATVLANDVCILHDVPDLEDIHVMVAILQTLGAKVRVDEKTVIIDPRTITSTEIPEHLMRKMRSSIFLMGPLLAKFSRVRISMPGGCSIGSRPIDLHRKGLWQLGATIVDEHGFIECTASQLCGAMVCLDFPSVGATENLMMAAVLAKGETVITNAAREPEIKELARFLTLLGAKIRGAGEDTMIIEGVPTLRSAEIEIAPDRIVTGTMMIAAAMTQGHIEIENTRPHELHALIGKLREAGVQVRIDRDIIEVKRLGAINAIDRIQTAPHPGFPTDLQAPMMALLSMAKGTSIIAETIFEDRFQHVSELQRMGAMIKLDLRTAFVQGVPRLSGAIVEATDLRAGAALVLAGLAASGTTIVDRVDHIDRGYESLEKQLRQLGANVIRLHAKKEKERTLAQV